MTEEKIMEFFRKKGRGRGLSLDTDLFKGGFIDSLFAFEMVLYLEKTFGIKIKNSELNEENFRTVSAIAGVVRRSGGE